MRLKHDPSQAGVSEQSKDGNCIYVNPIKMSVGIVCIGKLLFVKVKQLFKFPYKNQKFHLSCNVLGGIPPKRCIKKYVRID